MNVEFMKEEDVLGLLEEVDDVLTPKTKLGPRRCPTCGSVLTFIAGERTEGKLRCIACGTEVDPETGLITKLGLVSKTTDVDVRFITRSPGTSDPKTADRERRQS